MPLRIPDTDAYEIAKANFVLAFRRLRVNVGDCDLGVDATFLSSKGEFSVTGTALAGGGANACGIVVAGSAN